MLYPNIVINVKYLLYVIEKATKTTTSVIQLEAS